MSSTGSVPGSPRQIGQVSLFGASPNRVEHAQKILELVRSWTCTSNPITGSYLASTSGAIPAVSWADFTIREGNYSIGGLSACQNVVNCPKTSNGSGFSRIKQAPAHCEMVPALTNIDYGFPV